ncbi:hypothetical protein [Bacillus mycoides]|uniref:hypothetical protein n=1 Tax=Bacillus mycoides TaxID=1405 RepID=UPI001C6E0A2A|nr:hypothetical protein [Bacillus mycoides]
MNDYNNYEVFTVGSELETIYGIGCAYETMLRTIKYAFFHSYTMTDEYPLYKSI